MEWKASTTFLHSRVGHIEEQKGDVAHIFGRLFAEFVILLEFCSPNLIYQWKLQVARNI